MPFVTSELLPGQMAGQTFGPLVAECLLKSVAVLTVAGLMVLPLRKASAAVKHVVWLVAVLALALLPALSLALPGWGVMPGWEVATAQRAEPVANTADPAAPAPPRRPHPTESLLPPGLGSNARDAARSLTDAPPAAPKLSHAVSRQEVQSAERLTPSGWSSLPWGRALILGWAGGVGLLLSGMAIGLFSLAWRGRRARPIDDDRLRATVGRLCHRLGVRRRVRLLEGGPGVMPMTWTGLPGTAAKLLLPTEAHGWDEARLEAVLLHELAHLKRRDCLTQTLAHLVACFYWPNPLVWVALWRMRLERERASDDLVLASGQRASDYAEHLLAVATSLRPTVLGSGAAIAMAKRSGMEGRVMALLDRNRNRRTLSRTDIALTATLLSALVVPVAMVGAEPQPATPEAAAESDRAEAEPADQPLEKRLLGEWYGGGLLPSTLEIEADGTFRQHTADGAEAGPTAEKGTWQLDGRRLTLRIDETTTDRLQGAATRIRRVRVEGDTLVMEQIKDGELTGTRWTYHRPDAGEAGKRESQQDRSNADAGSLAEAAAIPDMAAPPAYDASRSPSLQWVPYWGPAKIPDEAALDTSGEHPRFVIKKPGSHRYWKASLKRPIAPARYPRFVLKYRAKNLTPKNRVVLRFQYGRDGLYCNPVLTKCIQDDGEVHTLRVDLRGPDPRGGAAGDRPAPGRARAGDARQRPGLVPLRGGADAGVGYQLP